LCFPGKDVIGLAQTGSGKTAAFALPILHALLEDPNPFFACVLSPTRLDMIITHHGFNIHIILILSLTHILLVNFFCSKLFF
jgi:hypothetical protein